MTPQAFSYATVANGMIYCPPYGLTESLNYMIKIDPITYSVKKIPLEVDNSTEKYIYGTYLLFFIMVFALILNITLIPFYGIAGAAFATALSTVVYNLLKYLIILKIFKMQPYDTSSLKILLVIAISLFITYFLPSFNNAVFAMFIKTIVIITVYGGLLYLLKIVPEFHKYLKLK